MNIPNKIFSTTICFILFATLFTSCKTSPKKNEAAESKDTTTSTLPLPAWLDSTKTLKEKVLTAYIISAKKINPNTKHGRPFDNLDYDKLIAYDFEGSEEPYSAVIDSKGKFVPVILQQQYLSQEQADKILATLTNTSTYGALTAACFNPHLALVFYKENKPINQINICLDCNYLISDIVIPAETYKKVHSGTKDEYALIGFTDSGRKGIIDLCKEIKFTYGNKKVQIK
jgi:hypothetical protein